MPRYRVPVRVGTRVVPTRSAPPKEVGEASPEGTSHTEERAREESIAPSTRENALHSAPGSKEDATEEQTVRSSDETSRAPSGVEDATWRERALRLQAEMSNYRKRQQRIAQDQARAGEERLLLEMLGVVDNLDRTLAAARAPSHRADSSIRQGVAMTRDQVLRILRKHDVERIHAQGEPFDPHWHEAVAVVPARDVGVEAGTVIEVTKPGYRRGERLFRAASVVVAQ